MKVTLPDGSPLELPDGATGADAARAIGEGLARAALGVRQNGDLRDLDAPLAEGPVEIVTAKDPDALWLIRHDAAHVLATAVLELYPGVKISIGPPIDDGFYYDFEFPEGVKVSRGRLRAHRGRRCASTSPPTSTSSAPTFRWRRRSSASRPRTRTTRSS